MRNHDMAINKDISETIFLFQNLFSWGISYIKTIDLVHAIKFFLMVVLANSFNKEFQFIFRIYPLCNYYHKERYFVNADEIKLYQRSRVFEF